ncbi:hypothetical protein [Rhodoferax sp.]|uniref:hypothetical protein n=1 Tax=Rhodoferax sp. TaxID=50421 RepID=UPI002756D992|nr:hypothetical protein [Rhodoferax sp.]
MAFTSNRSFKALGLAVALGAALTIHGTMLWGFDGIAAQAAASCAADHTKTAISRPAALQPAQTPTGAAAAKTAAPA